jgi:hypothetical protein
MWEFACICEKRMSETTTGLERKECQIANIELQKIEA